MRLRSFLSLPVIIPPLPFNIQNGDPVDAVPVMADLNFIVSSVNANAQSITSIVPTAFTPTVSFAGGTTGITYALRLGTWSRLASIVFFTVDLIVSNIGSDTGALWLQGLPATCASDWPGAGVASQAVCVANMTYAPGSYVTCAVVPTTDHLIFRSSTSGSTSNFITDAECSNGLSISVSGFYAAA